MRYLSVCSGVEAASIAWEPLGWTPVGFSEIEPFPSAVLAHRFPQVKNYGDLTRYKEWDIEPGSVDLLVGGTPCQSFSVAGLRKGLEDPRGNLALVFLGLADHLRVPWVVWENVPGVLSSSGGRDFGSFLGALEQLGYRWSYRTLDAQFFGVPQRRRRVFVVAHLGDRHAPEQVLFESESLRGDSAKSGQTRKGSPRGARQGAESGSRIDCTSAGITGTVSSKWHKGTGGPAGDEHYNLVTTEAVGTLCSDTHPGAYSGQDAYTGRLVPQFFDEQASGSQYGTSGVASTCSTRDHKDATDLVVTATGPVTQLPIGLDEEQNAVVDGFGTLKARMLGGGFEGTVAVSATGTLGARASSGGGFSTDFEVAGGLQPITVLDTYNQSVSQDVTPPMTVGNAGNTVPNVLVGGLQAVDIYNGRITGDTTATLTKAMSQANASGAQVMTPTMQVRRLLPVECERLQGFPDDHTLIPWKKKPASECPDGPRYKAMGNSMAVPVMRWIGERIAKVSALAVNADEQ